MGLELLAAQLGEMYREGLWDEETLDEIYRRLFRLRVRLEGLDIEDRRWVESLAIFKKEQRG